MTDAHDLGAPGVHDAATRLTTTRPLASLPPLLYHVVAGNLHFFGTRWSAAAQSFEEALHIAPNTPVALANASAAYFAIGTVDALRRSVHAAARCIAAAPAWARGYHRLGIALRGVGAFASARTALEACVRVAAATPKPAVGDTPIAHAAAAAAPTIAADAAAALEELAKMQAYEGAGDHGVDVPGLFPADETGAVARGLVFGTGAAVAGTAADGGSDDGAAGVIAAGAAATPASAPSDASPSSSSSSSSSSTSEADVFESLEHWLVSATPDGSVAAAATGGASTLPAPVAPGATATPADGGAAAAAATPLPPSTFPALYMRKYSEGNRGVHARADIGPEAEVMAIPRRFLITVEMAADSPPGRLLAAARIDRELSAAKHCYLALFVLWDRRNAGSFFQPYYRILPPAFPNMPIFWGDDELAWLKGSYFLQQVADRKENLTRDYEAITRAVPSIAEFASYHDFAWSRMMVASRNFGINIDGRKTDALVPYADMLNHQRPRQTRWAFDNRKQAFTMTSLVKLHAGQQVYDSYGKKCNSRFLLNYGFCVDRNVDDDVGQAHNEIRLLCEMKPHGEDPWYAQKVRLLSDAATRDDWAVSYATTVSRLAATDATADGRRMSAPVQTSRSIRVAQYYDHDGTTEAFSFLRFVHAKGHEIVYLPRMGADYDLVRRPIEPLSLDNELDVLKHIAALCTAQLSKYATTLEEDVDLLKSGSLEMGSNHRNAVVLLKGEKELCHFYIELHRVVAELAALPWPDAQARIAARHVSASDIDKYVCHIAARLLQRRHDDEAAAALLGSAGPLMREVERLLVGS